MRPQAGGRLPTGRSRAATLRMDLCLSDRTLRDWRESWANDKLHPGSRGRPSKRASQDQRLEMIGILWMLGVGTGWDAIKPSFPDLSRREGRRLLRRVRKLWKRLERDGELALEWKRPGTVWALDFTDAPNAIDAMYPYILDVRDLASGKQLMSLPCEDETEATATAAMKALIAQHGAPLVLKADNGLGVHRDGLPGRARGMRNDSPLFPAAPSRIQWILRGRPWIDQDASPPPRGPKGPRGDLDLRRRRGGKARDERDGKAPGR